MKNKILIADDEESVRRMISRMIAGISGTCEVLNAPDGSEALRLAQDENPDLILLDLNMPVRDGWSVLRELRSNAKTRLIPVILVSGQGELSSRVAGLEQGADDYVCKPFAVAELRARVERLLRRFRQDIGANPLTRLPGNALIEEEVGRRIREGRPFAFLCADIDLFKPYNDHYGFARGDAVICETARVLECALRRGDGAGLLGHLGGDDFVLVTDASDAPVVAHQAAKLFDLSVPDFYCADDYARGGVEGRDRAGQRRHFPLIRLSIGVVTTQRRKLSNYAQAIQVASEMKAFLKSGREATMSRFAFDRRAGP